MGTFRRFEDIDAWREARQLCRGVYRASSKAPFATDFPLRDQIRKAALSVVSNIAEGFERHRYRTFIHFLDIAKGSAAEVKAQLYAARDAGYLSADDFEELFQQADRTSQIIYGLIKHLERKGSPRSSGTWR